MSDKKIPKGAAGTSPEGERIQKVLARVGAGSRRQVERWIVEGRVTVGGRRATLGQRVTPQHVIRVDGRLLPRSTTIPKRRILMYHKPAGEMCTRSDPQGRPTVFDRLPRLRSGRWISIGRLDFNTSGLLLLTTDGELANRLMHPRHGIEREYAARILGKVDEAMLKRLTKGVRLKDGPARFECVVDAGGEGANRWYHVTLKEGRHHEVRRMWEAMGVKVSRLIRVRYGPVTLPRHLRAGRLMDLDQDATQALLHAVGLDEEKKKRQPRRARNPSTKRKRSRAKVVRR